MHSVLTDSQIMLISEICIHRDGLVSPCLENFVKIRLDIKEQLKHGRTDTQTQRQINSCIHRTFRLWLKFDKQLLLIVQNGELFGDNQNYVTLYPWTCINLFALILMYSLGSSCL
jgi:hypothetical protein